MGAVCRRLLRPDLDTPGRHVHIDHARRVRRPDLQLHPFRRALDDPQCRRFGVLALDEGRQEGDRLAASYVNFYFCNGGVVVPTFNDPMDAVALARLQELLPERRVVGVYSREILLGGGNIHCITQQVPAAVTNGTSVYQ